MVSVSLRSYIHSYFKGINKAYKNREFPFPSPYGVIFILTRGNTSKKKERLGEFPSPYGVIFILMCFLKYWMTLFFLSFRLLTELYSFLFKSDISDTIGAGVAFPSPYGVIFILIQIQLS